jgi:hypothetical protein
MSEPRVVCINGSGPANGVEMLGGGSKESSVLSVSGESRGLGESGRRSCDKEKSD